MQTDKADDYKSFEKLKNDTSSYLEKGSVELLSKTKNEIEKLKYMEEKELLFTKEDKDDDKLSRNSRSQSDFGINCYGKRFDFDALNKDLADIEERLKATRMSWNNNTNSNAKSSNNFNDSERKWQSMAEVDIHRDSRNNQVNDGELVFNESPILSDCGGGAMKWDYGADIGLSTHGDSADEFDPMTWPVTAEQAAKEQAEQANGGRRIKPSASQGSFLASPDPDHRQNIIAKASAEVAAAEADIKTNKNFKSSFDDCQSKPENDHSKLFSSPPNLIGEKHEKECLSANAIMDQAEEAEKRLRQRLENVKSMHLNGSINKDELPQSSIVRPTELERKKGSKSNTDETLTSSGNHNEQIRLNSVDEKSTGSNTGRASTVESTHTFSDYGKAPLFSASVYGTREDNSLRNNYPNNLMYSKRNKDGLLGRTTELETISSRETLHVLPNNDEAEKDMNNAGNTLPPSHCFEGASQIFHRPDNRESIARTNKSLEEKKEYGRSSGALVPPISIPQPPAPAPINSGLSSNGQRQQNSSTTFTSITTANCSPRQVIDSFDTDYGMGSPRGPGISILDQKETRGQEENQEKRTKDIPIMTSALTENSKPSQQRYSNNSQERYNSYSRSPNRHSKHLGTNNGNEDDGEDEDENNRRRRQYDIDKRKERHTATAQAFKNLKMHQQAHSKDRSHHFDNAAGETTASELEHDDNDEEGDENGTGRTPRRNRGSDDTGARRKKKKIAKLVHKLNSTNHYHDRTRFANAGSAKEDSGPESSSVDTVMLMDRLATMLGNGHQQERPSMDTKKFTPTYPHQIHNMPAEDFRRQTYGDHFGDHQRNFPDVRSYPAQPPPPSPSQHHIYPNNVPYHDLQYQQHQMMPNLDSKLVVRHLLLKHKVKWLVDCVREKTRRRKIKKLEKLLEIHDQNDQMMLPDDLYTETATVIGSDNVGSVGDLQSLSESWSCRSDQSEHQNNAPAHPFMHPHQMYENEMHHFNNDPYYNQYNGPADHHQPDYHQEEYEEIPQANGDRNSFRQQYSHYKRNKEDTKGGMDQHSRKKSRRKVYPPSQTWNIPLQEGAVDTNVNNDANEYCKEFEEEPGRHNYDSYHNQYDEPGQQPVSGQQRSNKKSKKIKVHRDYGENVHPDDKRPHYRNQYEDLDEYHLEQSSNLRYSGQKRHGELSTGRSGNLSDNRSRGSGRPLSLRERINLIREADSARQHNAHRVEKDLRRTQTKSTKVSNGGLAWMIGSEEDNYSISNENKNSADEHKGQSDLQVAFENRMHDFISRSKQRQKRIKLASDERRYQSQMSLERAKLFAEPPQTIDDANYYPSNMFVSNDKPGTFKRRRPITQPDPLSAKTTDSTRGRTDNQCDNATMLDRPVVTKLDLSKLKSRDKKDRYLKQTAEHLFKPQPRRFSKNEMIHTSARKYKNLPEMLQKYSDERKRARIQHNRIKRMQYSEKILSQVLRSRGPWITEKST